MTRLEFSDYLTHLRNDSIRFREVLAGCDPAVRVPACPDWDAADLLWHLTEVQQFWATIITTRPAGPAEDGPPARPSSYAGLLAAHADASTSLATALEAADPAEEAWHWADEHTVGISYRRQAHEALIHRLDAEQTAGRVTGLDPALAADGVAELFEVMYGGPVPAWGRFEPAQGLVKISLTDVGVDFWTRSGLFYGSEPESGRSYDGPHLVLVDPPGGEADAVVAGAAADLDAWLWNRRDDAGVSQTGDETALAAFRVAVSPSLD